MVVWRHGQAALRSALGLLRLLRPGDRSAARSTTWPRSGPSGRRRCAACSTTGWTVTCARTAAGAAARRTPKGGPLPKAIERGRLGDLLAGARAGRAHDVGRAAGAAARGGAAAGGAARPEGDVGRAGEGGVATRDPAGRRLGGDRRRAPGRSGGARRACRRSSPTRGPTRHARARGAGAGGGRRHRRRAGAGRRAGSLRGRAALPRHRPEPGQAARSPRRPGVDQAPARGPEPARDGRGSRRDRRSGCRRGAARALASATNTCRSGSRLQRRWRSWATRTSRRWSTRRRARRRKRPSSLPPAPPP